MQSPLVPAHVDLRDFDYMPLHVNRLRDSGFTANVKPEEFRAGVLLWASSWHQLPAGSLPDDDGQLAKLAGYGYIVKAWKRIKVGALYGWIACDDKRLYHPTVAEVVLSAWESKLKHAYGKFVDRMRKENKRLAESKQPQASIPTFEDWKSAGIPPEIGKTSAGIPLEFPLKGREGKGSELQKREVGVTPPTMAVDNSEGQPRNSNPGQQWDSQTWVNATATTVGKTQLPGEPFADFRDRVYGALQARIGEAKRATA